jgi:hypothetical protein
MRSGARPLVEVADDRDQGALHEDGTRKIEHERDDPEQYAVPVVRETAGGVGCPDDCVDDRRRRDGAPEEEPVDPPRSRERFADGDSSYTHDGAEFTSERDRACSRRRSASG